MQTPDRLNREAVTALAEALGVDGVSDLARRSGIERSYLSRILKGDRPAQNSHIVAIAAALKVGPIAITGPGPMPEPAAVAG